MIPITETVDIIGEISKYLLYLMPLALLSLGLQIYSWVDLARKRRTRNLSVLIWFLITFINMIGPIAYLILGRAEDSQHE